MYHSGAGVGGAADDERARVWGQKLKLLKKEKEKKGKKKSLNNNNNNKSKGDCHPKHAKCTRHLRSFHMAHGHDTGTRELILSERPCRSAVKHIS